MWVASLVAPGPHDIRDGVCLPTVDRGVAIIRWVVDVVEEGVGFGAVLAGRTSSGCAPFKMAWALEGSVSVRLTYPEQPLEAWRQYQCDCLPGLRRRIKSQCSGFISCTSRSA